MDERRRILEMVAEGTITVDDGERLLAALGEGGHAARPAAWTDDGIQRTIGSAIADAIEDSVYHSVATRTRMKRRASSIDDIVSFASHGVSADFVRELREIWPDLDPDDVISMASNGVRSAFITEVRGVWEDVQPDDLVELAANGVRPDLIRAARAVSPEATRDDIISLAGHGVRTDDLTEFADLVPGLSLDDIIELKSHGVTAQYVRTLNELSVTGLSAGEIVERASE